MLNRILKSSNLSILFLFVSISAATGYLGLYLVSISFLIMFINTLAKEYIKTNIFYINQVIAYLIGAIGFIDNNFFFSILYFFIAAAYLFLLFDLLKTSKFNRKISFLSL